MEGFWHFEAATFWDFPAQFWGKLGILEPSFRGFGNLGFGYFRIGIFGEFGPRFLGIFGVLGFFFCFETGIFWGLLSVVILGFWAAGFEYFWVFLIFCNEVNLGFWTTVFGYFWVSVLGFFGILNRGYFDIFGLGFVVNAALWGFLFGVILAFENSIF